MIQEQVIAPAKLEKPKSLAAFAEAMQTEVSEGHRAEPDVSTHDPFTPIARFFTASIVGSTVMAEDDFDSIDEDTPFPRQKSISISDPALGLDIWKNGSFTEVNAMKPHVSHSPSRVSLAGFIVADSDDGTHTHPDATSSEESIPQASRRSRASSNVHVMAFPNPSQSTVSTASDHVMRTDPGVMHSRSPSSGTPFLLRTRRAPISPPPAYADATRQAAPPPTQEKGRIIPHQRWLMGDRRAGQEAVRDVLSAYKPKLEYRQSAEIRMQKNQKKWEAQGRAAYRWELLKVRGNICQKAWASTMLAIRSRKVVLKGPMPELRSENVAPPAPPV